MRNKRTERERESRGRGEGDGWIAWRDIEERKRKEERWRGDETERIKDDA